MNILSLNPRRVKRFTKQGCRENVVASFFPLKIYIYIHICKHYVCLDASLHQTKLIRVCYGMLWSPKSYQFLICFILKNPQ